ncbi:MAG TPA: hypothetical protein HA360_02890 [Nanoarchaeota archaeon]|nr:hypothetical protein [Nanoarchaeota archaeon]HII13997.1 hypothetical protein [Nanoarchaeota archaeon]HIJ04750.1 hypothetical protein [Nanoarchaeota archaeon]
MKELEKMAIEDLLRVYNSYITKKKIDKEMEEKAKRVYNEYTPGSRLLRSEINEAVGKLFCIAYPNVFPGDKAPTVTEAKELIKKLKTINL